MSLDIAAGVFTLIGVWLVGSKNKFGFIFAIGSNVLWIYYALNLQQSYGIVLECVPLAIINVRNFIKWCKQDTK